MVLSQDDSRLQAENSTFNVQAELDETKRSLSEVTLMIEQSQGEAGKLTQRNAAITAHLQQVQAQLDNMPIEEIRMAYDSALDAQQRLFIMRGQLDKLQKDKTHLERYQVALTQMSNMKADSASLPEDTGQAAPSSVEMIINAQEAERQRLSRQMHDGPAQALSNFILQTEIAMRLMDVDVNQAREELSSLKATAMGTFQKVRTFIFELRPMMLDDLGLIPTIRRYAENFKEQSGLDMNLMVSGTERRLESYLEVMVFRALQELLGNVSRHSQATVLKVHVDVSDDTVKVSVDDNGKGFDASIIQQGSSLGLKLIQDRVEMLGGNFNVDSIVGKGARITFSVPAADAG